VRRARSIGGSEIVRLLRLRSATRGPRRLRAGPNRAAVHRPRRPPWRRSRRPAERSPPSSRSALAPRTARYGRRRHDRTTLSAAAATSSVKPRQMRWRHPFGSTIVPLRDAAGAIHCRTPMKCPSDSQHAPRAFGPNEMRAALPHGSGRRGWLPDAQVWRPMSAAGSSRTPDNRWLDVG
jgi:hypothetical protein